MKMKLVKTTVSYLFFAFALLSLVAAETESGRGAEGGRGGSIQGMWETQITLND